MIAQNCGQNCGQNCAELRASAAAFCCIAAAISPPAHRLPIARAAWQSTAKVCEPDPCSCALRSIETASGSAFAWRMFGR